MLFFNEFIPTLRTTEGYSDVIKLWSARVYTNATDWKVQNSNIVL